MDRWTEMNLLVQVADTGSMSRAAEALGISNAVASRAMAAMEQRLGARLVERNTRRLYLTDTGQQFLERCKALLADLEDAEAAVNANTLAPTGRLRISASLSFAVRHIAPLLPEYLKRYPKVTVHVETSNRYLDLIDNNIDVAVRTREVEADSSISVRPLAQTRRILAASAEYLAAHGIPREPADLARHRLLLYMLANNPHELRFTREGARQAVKVQGTLESNDGQVLRAAALHGLGILVQPTYILHEDIKAGNFVPILEDWDLPTLNINLAYPSRKHLSAKVRTFIDFMVEHFSAHQYTEQWMRRFPMPAPRPAKGRSRG
jgi:DNA-binding transcriptional LysR family regulator